jgi:hypothetical protein
MADIKTANPLGPSSSSDEPSDVDTPSKPKAPRSKQLPPEPSISSGTIPQEGIRRREYCTQACLLGVKDGLPLDEACPNVSAHKVDGLGDYHFLSRKTLKKAISRQLHQTLDKGCEPLGKQGSRGALFRVTLETYGYTFVAKGTVEAFRTKLRHEADVYRHLRKVQGQLVPVYLGSVSLKRPYFLDVGVKIVHMLMMSWVGEKAEQELAGPTRPWDTNATDLKTAVAVEELRRHGVQHNDVRPPNVLWSVELGKVMLIDFERSKFIREVPAVADSSYKHRRQHLKEGTFQFLGEFCKEEFRAEPEWAVQASNIVV